MRIALPPIAGLAAAQHHLRPPPRSNAYDVDLFGRVLAEVASLQPGDRPRESTVASTPRTHLTPVAA